MTVDPNVDGSNSEVCDPCGPNCVSTYLDFFEADGAYIATSQDFPPSFDYDFFINGIVTPAEASKCSASAEACDYAPPGRLAGWTTGRYRAAITELLEIMAHKPRPENPNDRVLSAALDYLTIAHTAQHHGDDALREEIAHMALEGARQTLTRLT